MKGRLRLFLTIMCVCCLFGGCGDKSIPAKDGDNDKSSVSSSAEKKEKDVMTQTESTDGQKEERQNEDGFVSDWKEGHENYYGYGKVEDWNRSGRLKNYVVQDGWLYYSSSDKIYKMPIGGGAKDVQTVYDAQKYGYFFSYGSDTLHIEVVEDWIYYFISYGDETGGLWRVRTDGSMPTQILCSEDMSWHFNRTGESYYYVAGEKAYFIAKEKMGASEDSANYYLASVDINTSEVTKIRQVEKETGLLVGFENSIILRDPYERVDLSGNTITEFSTEYSPWEFILWSYEDGMATFINEETDYNTNKFYLIKHFQNGEIEKTQIDYYGNIFVDVKKGEYYYEGHFPLDFPKENYADSMMGLYYGNNKGENCKINNDCPCIIFSGFDDYVYYDTGGYGFGNYYSYIPVTNTEIKYRVKRDGTGFEEVSWMFP